jgi:phosphatidylglycerophosphate synthase
MVVLAVASPLCQYRDVTEIIHSTAESWRSFSTIQKLAAVATNGLTIARPLITSVVSRRGLDKDHVWTTGDAGLLGTAYLTDLEGGIARAYDAQTRLGGALDPVADKLATNMQELVLAHRGEESYARAGTRLARDIGISALRRYASNSSAGTAEINATTIGKANTAFRKGAVVFATSPLGARYPRIRTGLQYASTATTVVSGAVTAKRLLQQKKQTPKTASRE